MARCMMYSILVSSGHIRGGKEQPYLRQCCQIVSLNMKLKLFWGMRMTLTMSGFSKWNGLVMISLHGSQRFSYKIVRKWMLITSRNQASLRQSSDVQEDELEIDRDLSSMKCPWQALYRTTRVHSVQDLIVKQLTLSMLALCWSQASLP